VPAFVQRAGIAALEGGDAAVEERRVELRRRRDVAVAALRRVSGVACAEPRGAFYVFPNLGETLRRTGETSAELCGRLLHDREVATLPGVAFGRNGRDALRIALTAPGARLVEAIDRLHSLVRLEHAAALAPRRRPARSESSGGAA
jgi:aspartate/methionine/tyrosine aminotransferase